MAGELHPGVAELLTNASFVHLATLLADGSPHSVAIWAGIHEGRPCFFTGESSVKARNLARDPRLAMSVVDRHDPYRTGRLRGRVAATLEGEEALEVIDAISVAYTGKPFPRRSGTVYLVDVERSGFTELPFQDTPQA